LESRVYQKKKTAVEKLIKKMNRIDHVFILNEIDIDYDLLMIIIKELRNEGRIRT